MPNVNRSYLPPEILDYIVDHLYDERETLKQCCLVSKSWIPRTRKHLFADIKFSTDRDLEAWQKAFPDPSRSPAHYTHALTIDTLRAITAADAEEGNWIRILSRAVQLGLYGSHNKLDTSLAPFHRFSSSLKSLRVVTFTIPQSHVFNLIRSLPLLENLTLIDHNPSIIGDDESDELPNIIPPTSPPLTGTLELLLGGVETITRRLLNLPSLHFRKLVFFWRHKEDTRWMDELVMTCSSTLECLDVKCRLLGNPSPVSIDLSNATKLQDAVFRPGSLYVDWITMALRTITPKHRDLRQISIYLHCPSHPAGAEVGVVRAIGRRIYEQWLDLDRLLVQFWESHSIRPRLVRTTPAQETPDAERCIGRLLPEVTKRGIAELVEQREP